MNLGVQDGVEYHGVNEYPREEPEVEAAVDHPIPVPALPPFQDVNHPDPPQERDVESDDEAEDQRITPAGMAQQALVHVMNQVARSIANLDNSIQSMNRQLMGTITQQTTYIKATDKTLADFQTSIQSLRNSVDDLRRSDEVDDDISLCESQREVKQEQQELLDLASSNKHHSTMFKDITTSAVDINNYTCLTDHQIHNLVNNPNMWNIGDIAFVKSKSNIYLKVEVVGMASYQSI